MIPGPGLSLCSKKKKEGGVEGTCFGLLANFSPVTPAFASFTHLLRGRVGVYFSCYHLLKK